MGAATKQRRQIRAAAAILVSIVHAPLQFSHWARSQIGYAPHGGSRLRYILIVNHFAEQAPATAVSSSKSVHTGIHPHPTSEPVRYLGSLNTSILLLAHMSCRHYIENTMFSWSLPFNRESFSGGGSRILCAELTRLPRANKWKHVKLCERCERYSTYLRRLNPSHAFDFSSRPYRARDLGTKQHGFDNPPGFVSRWSAKHA